MANIRNGNTFFIDTQAASATTADSNNLIINNARVGCIVLTGVGGAGLLDLHDVTTDAHKIHVKIGTGETLFLNFGDTPILFPNGICPRQVSNCEATLVIRESER